MPRVRYTLQCSQNFPFELPVVLLSVDQGNLLVLTLSQFFDFGIFPYLGRCHLKQNIAIDVLDIGQRRYDRHGILLGIPDYGRKFLFVNRAYDQAGRPKIGVVHNRTESVAFLPGIEQIDPNGVSVLGLYLFKPQEKSLVEIEIIRILFVAIGHRQQQRHTKRLSTAQCQKIHLFHLGFDRRQGIALRWLGLSESLFRRRLGHGLCIAGDFQHTSRTEVLR